MEDQDSSKHSATDGLSPKIARSYAKRRPKQRLSRSTSSLLPTRSRPYKSMKRRTTFDATLKPEKSILKNSSVKSLGETETRASFSKRVSFSDSMNNRWNSHGSKMNLQSTVSKQSTSNPDAMGNHSWTTATTNTTGPNIQLSALKLELTKFAPPAKPARVNSVEAQGPLRKPKRTNSDENPFQVSVDSFRSALVKEARSSSSQTKGAPADSPVASEASLLLKAPVQPQRRTSLETGIKQSPIKPKKRDNENEE